MKKLFGIFGTNQKQSENNRFTREELEKRVERETEKAIRKYGYVFRKLAEYDRT